MKTNVAASLMLLTGVVVVTSGCGGDSGTPSSPESSQPAVVQTDQGSPQSSDPATATAGQAPPSSRRPNEVWTDDDGNRFIGNVPFDVFFDSPYEVVSDNTSLVPGGAVSTAAADTPAMSPASDPPVAGPGATEDPAPTPAGAASAGWQSVLPKSELESEIKDIRNFMQQNLQSVATYNSAMLMIPPKAATMAALAQVAMQHEDPVTWQEDAIYIRDLARQMNESALKRGPKDQRRLLGLFENISDTLNRSRPAGLADPPAEHTFVDVAEMGDLMKRMEDSQKWLATETGSEDSLREKAAAAAHEAAILGALAKITTTEGYGYSDDPDFKAYADDVTAAASEMQAAAVGGDFTSFDQLKGRISQACSSCHSDYRNN